MIALRTHATATVVDDITLYSQLSLSIGLTPLLFHPDSKTCLFHKIMSYRRFTFLTSLLN